MSALSPPTSRTIELAGDHAWTITCMRDGRGARWRVAFTTPGWPPIVVHVVPLDPVGEQVAIVAEVANDLIARTCWRCTTRERLEQWLAFTFATAPGAPRLTRRSRRALARLILEDRWPAPRELAA